MRTKYGFTFFLASVFIFSQFFISNAYAYIDPGSVSVAFALIIGVVVGAGMTIKLYWLKLKNKLISIFILPPNIETLRDRLSNRDMKDKLILKRRMIQFKDDVLHWKEYDYVVINNDLEKCYQAIMSIINSEKKGISKKQDFKEIEKKVYEYLKIIKNKGGMIKCIEENYIQEEIETSAFNFQIELEKKERIVVGVNDFVATNEEPLPIQEIDPNLESNQIKRLRRLKKKRNSKKVQAHLVNLENAARQNENLMPYIVEAVSEYCTIGEMISCLENVYGRFQGST